jgi:Lamprin
VVRRIRIGSRIAACRSSWRCQFQLLRHDEREVRLGWAGLGWAGLGWAGLGWAGLGWAGLGWAGLDTENLARLDKNRIRLARLGWLSLATHGR